LFLMNSPFVLQQARGLAHRAAATATSPPAQTIEELYKLVFLRPPSKDEANLGERFLSTPSQTSTNTTPLEKYAQILLLSNELSFVD
jgi:hypothetical protein